MTKKEIRTIQNVIKRLKADRLGAAEGYNNDISRIYVDTWLIGPLECLLPGEGRDTDLAERLSK
jgi:hypothetical protein